MYTNDSHHTAAEVLIVFLWIVNSIVKTIFQQIGDLLHLLSRVLNFTLIHFLFIDFYAVLYRKKSGYSLGGEIVSF